jgi:hypothetical protein
MAPSDRSIWFAIFPTVRHAERRLAAERDAARDAARGAMRESLREIALQEREPIALEECEPPGIWRAGFLLGVLVGFGSALVWYFALRLLAAGLGGKP